MMHQVHWTLPEAALKKALNQYCRNMTVLIVSQRVSTVKHLDKIIVFGSFVAREREQRKRDIDILIVSNDFELMSSFMRRNVVKKCMEGLNVDPICMTKKEFNRLKKITLPFPGKF